MSLTVPGHAAKLQESDTNEQCITSSAWRPLFDVDFRTLEITAAFNATAAIAGKENSPISSPFLLLPRSGANRCVAGQVRTTHLMPKAYR